MPTREAPGTRRPPHARWSVRTRATLGSVAVVALFLTIGSFAFVALVSQSLRTGVEQSAAADAETVAAQLEATGDPALPDDDDRLLVVVADGQVVARSDDDIVLPTPIPDTDTFTTVVDGDTVVFAGEDAEIDDREVRVYAGRSLEEADQATGIVSILLLVAVPMLVLVVGALTWIIVGRALAPVERIRREVAALGAEELHRRVEVPATGDEIGRLAVTMNGMLDRLEHAQSAQRRFVSDASHELRSPLAVIRQYAEVATAHPDHVDREELARTVLEEGERMQGLVESLLLLAKLDERAVVTARRPVDLDDLLLAEAQRLRGASNAIAVDASGVTAARVDGDGPLLGRAVRNLVDNAARHAHGRVRLSCAVDGAVVRVSVEDDGRGIRPEDRGRVLERFVRLDEARSRDAGGSGLGLAIVSDIVRVHGGRVEIGDAVLGGARFTLVLPAPQPS